MADALTEVAVGPGIVAAELKPDAAPTEATRVTPAYTVGPPQFNRKASLIVNYPATGANFDFSDLHFAFHIRQSDTQSPNIGEIRVWNVGKTINQQLLKAGEGARVVLQAGYEGSYGLIFDGEIKYFRTGRNSPVDTYLDLQCADSDIAYNFCYIRVTLAAGANTADLINETLKVLKPAPFNVSFAGYPDGMSAVRFPRGTVMFGLVRDVLRNIAQMLNCSWTLINKRLTFIPRESYIEGDTVELSYATGVVGIPEQTPDGIFVRCLLNPNIHVGRKVHLNNSDINQARMNLSYAGAVANQQVDPKRLDKDGFYKVLSIDYAGDIRGAPWYCDMMMVGINEQVPLSQAARGRVLPGAGAGNNPG